MDINGLIPAGAKPSYTPPAPGSGKAAAQALPQPQSAPLPDIAVSLASSQSAANQDAQRRELVERAAQSLQRDSFPVSDTRFTIFKDASGQYITRFTSLRDGKVTYYPEQSIFSYFQKLGGHDPFVNISA